jgi:hypothetical protein
LVFCGLYTRLFLLGSERITVIPEAGIRQSLFSANENDVIFIPAGNYSGAENCELDVSFPRVTLEGAGRDTLIFCGGDVS